MNDQRLNDHQRMIMLEIFSVIDGLNGHERQSNNKKRKIHYGAMEGLSYEATRELQTGRGGTTSTSLSSTADDDMIKCAAEIRYTCFSLGLMSEQCTKKYTNDTEIGREGLRKWNLDRQNYETVYVIKNDNVHFQYEYDSLTGELHWCDAILICIAPNNKGGSPPNGKIVNVFWGRDRENPYFPHISIAITDENILKEFHNDVNFGFTR